VGALRRNVGALRRNVGALRRNVGALRRNVGALVATWVRCVATSVRCVATWVRCVATWVRCVVLSLRRTEPLSRRRHELNRHGRRRRSISRRRRSRRRSPPLLRARMRSRRVGRALQMGTLTVSYGVRPSASEDRLFVRRMACSRCVAAARACPATTSLSPSLCVPITDGSAPVSYACARARACAHVTPLRRARARVARNTWAHVSVGVRVCV
jgi:hypothetical protein